MRRQITAVGRLFARCLRDERGGEALEYALVMALLAVGAYAVAQTFGLKLRALWQRLDDALGML